MVIFGVKNIFKFSGLICQFVVLQSYNYFRKCQKFSKTNFVAWCDVKNGMNGKMRSVEVFQLLGDVDVDGFVCPVEVADVGFGKGEEDFLAEDGEGEDDIAGVVGDVGDLPVVSGTFVVDAETDEVEDVAVVFRLVFLEEGLFEPYFTAHEALRLGDGIHVVEFDDVGGVVADGESVFGDEKRNRCPFE